MPKRVMENRHIIHLYNRFGFGLNASEISQLKNRTFETQLDQERLAPIQMDLSEFSQLDPQAMSAEDKKNLRKQARQKSIELNVQWMKQMISSRHFIHEKMNLFWHHHFACVIDNPIYATQFTNVIRKHATGNFRDLLLGISKSAAMIDFLHTRQNRKQHPNEDFARELCELFTLGLDREYSEQDIQEIARCFTGWNHQFNGEFVLRTRQHDYGEKTVFGKTGNFGGEDVIDLILKKKACARFICENIYQYFVHPDPKPDHIWELTEVFYASNYDIRTLIVHIAQAAWFYEDTNILSKIKSPIEFMVGLARQFQLDNKKPASWLTLQRQLDQVLFRPPGVKGWKVDREWIDSNSLPLRLRLPSILLTNGELDLETQPDYDANPGQSAKRNRYSKKLGFSYNWAYFFTKNRGTDFQELFFNGKLSPHSAQLMERRTFDSEMEEVIQLISLPEYQLI